MTFRLQTRTEVLRSSAGRRANGFTLMELLLVLAMLVVVAAMAMPALFRVMANQRLRQAADVVRAEWQEARVEAMRSGRIQMFRYQPSGTQFHIEPWFSASDSTESSYTSMDNQQQAADIQKWQTALANPRELPQGAQFVEGQIFMGSRDQQVAEQTTGAQAGNAAASASVALPILFYPDGTSSTTKLLLGNEEGYFVLIQLRGLTGLAQTSDLLSLNELSQL